jgi:hypothetical protein
MRRRSLIKASVATAATWSLSASAGPPVASPMVLPVASPVVIELFTSQGCSSCPPADALLSELARRPEVVALAWHVDYWNHLGWHDPYASAEWTKRQRRYANLLNDEVYTPALVVNGAHMVVGSDRSAVQAAMAEPHPLPVGVELRRAEHGLMAWLGPRQDDAVVSLLIYDASHSTGVRAGENGGRTLREAHIVRSASVFEPGDATAVPLPDIALDQGAVLLVQNRDWVVLGVAQVRPARADWP